MAAALKTQPGKASVAQLLKSIDDEQVRRDCKQVAAMMKAATGKKPVIWGTAIVGFGSYHYKYSSGREGDWPVIGFAPRKQNISIYIMPGFKRYAGLMKKLGKCKTSVSCLYIKSLEDIDSKVLEQLIARAVADMHKMYPCT